jgi:glutathione S-transferase
MWGGSPGPGGTPERRGRELHPAPFFMATDMKQSGKRAGVSLRPRPIPPPAAPMLTLYIANKNYSSWSLRPWVLMSERGIDFTEQLVPFDGGGTQEQFRRFSPSAKVPCLVDGDTTVWDSLAIVEYLAERHPGIWPKDAGARAWARCAAAEMHSGFGALRSRCSMSCGIRVRLKEQGPELRRDLARLEALWIDGLVRHAGPWLAGAHFSAVDAFFAPVAFRIQTYGLETGPQAQAYVERLLGLPAMRRWYEAALREPWRDADHDVEIEQYGVVLEDLRCPPGAA